MSEIELSAFDFETERLHLRPLAVGDEALFHDLYTDPETMRFVALPLTSVQAANSFRKTVIRQQEPSLKGRFLAILEKSTQRPVGICGTSQYDADALWLEVGIVLRLEARSRGVAGEALTALIKRVFAVSSIQEIRMVFSAHHPAMERLNIRLGFTSCAGESGEEVFLSKRTWSVQRSTWFAIRTTNSQGSF